MVSKKRRYEKQMNKLIANSRKGLQKQTWDTYHENMQFDNAEGEQSTLQVANGLNLNSLCRVVRAEGATSAELERRLLRCAC